MIEFWEKNFEQWQEKKSRSKGESLDLGDIEMPQTWEDLQRLASEPGEQQFFYQAMGREIDTHLTPKGFTDAEVLTFCASYIGQEESDTWVELIGEGIAADAEQSMVDNLTALGEVLQDVRVETNNDQVCRQLFGLD
jgi:hypothetical protein